MVVCCELIILNINDIYVSYVIFFFSSRRRHTICALVTGVQTCALPIFGLDPDLLFEVTGDAARINRNWRHDREAFAPLATGALQALRDQIGRASCRERVCQYV